MVITSGGLHYSFDLQSEHRARKDAIRKVRDETSQHLENFARQRRQVQKQLYQDLKESGKERRKWVQAVRKSTRDDLAAANRMRRERRASYLSQRKEFSRALQEETQRIREESRESLKDYARTRNETNQALKERLREARDEISRSVNELRDDCANLRLEQMREIDSMRSDWQQQTGWRHRRQTPYTPETPSEHEGEELEQLKQALLKSINESPNGISLTAIGTNLEVEWRRLIRPAKELLEQGKIRKEDVEYFPAQKEKGGGEGGVKKEGEPEQIQI